MSQPRERWAYRGSSGRTFLHWGCLGPNVAALVLLVQSKMVDVNARDKWGETAAHCAAKRDAFRELEIMCAAGADMHAQDNCGSTIMELAIWNLPLDSRSLRVLVANGVRLCSVREYYHRYIDLARVAFECSVLRCRTKVAALLRIKKAGKLWRWDKFLLKEVAIAVWATRY